MTVASPAAYSGVANLEAMEEARNYNGFLVRLIESRAEPGDRLLDFGAGTGLLARPLAAAGYDVRCIEPDMALRVRLRAAGLEAHAALDAVPPASIDLAFAVNVIEHITDDVAAVAALRDRIKPGKRLLIYVPAFPLLYGSMDRAVGHVRRYRRRDLAGLLHRAGLRVETIAYQDSLGFAAALALNAFGSGSGIIDRRAVTFYDRFVFPASRVLDNALGRPFGKNLLAVARRDG
jgi:SAM-dependent methyltransferase